MKNIYKGRNLSNIIDKTFSSFISNTSTSNDLYKKKEKKIENKLNKNSKKIITALKNKNSNTPKKLKIPNNSFLNNLSEKAFTQNKTKRESNIRNTYKKLYIK